ncbi:MAG: thioredoxin-disulfide reductase [Desulfohalobiaceae bacterium]
MYTYDAAVIGGGPAGITAALYLLRAGATVAWLEKLAPGGQVLLTEWIDNYPGFPQGIKGYELVDEMAKHLDGFSLDKYTDEVSSIQQDSGQNLIQVGDDQVQARSVVVCTGADHKKLGLPGEEQYTGSGVSYCGLCDGQFFRDQVVACIGGGNTALEDALYLSGLASKVYLIHRRSQFRGDKIYEEKVRAEPKIELLLNTVPKQIKGSQQVEQLEVENVQDGEQQALDVDGVFIFVGLVPQVGFLPQDIQKDETGFIITDTEMRTNLPGVFAAGDVRSKRCRQVSTAVGDGAAAGHSAYLYLEETRNV